MAKQLITADVMERIAKLLVDKYEFLLKDMLIGYPLNKNEMQEIMCLLHILHFLGFDEENSKERLEILAYYV